MTLSTPARADFSSEAQQTRELLRDLHRARPAIYWADLAATALSGWTAFSFSCLLPLFTPGMLIAFLLAVFALYRGLCFVHEISHLNPKIVPGFEAAWNTFIGYPLLMPSFVYCGVHQSHHKLSTYGTSQDPEYMPFAQSSRMTVVFALESFFIPVALLIRFLLLTPLGWFSPRLHQWLVVHASSLTMNLAYRREAAPELVRAIRGQSAVIWSLWTVFLTLSAAGKLPWRIFVTWLLVSAVISFVNTLRTLGAHAYESDGDPLDREGQLLDSIDTPGSVWTELWAPVGLRYHALHHYFPGVPYHNLKPAYDRLMTSLPPSSVYSDSHSASLAHSLSRLYAKGNGMPGRSSAR